MDDDPRPMFALALDQAGDLVAAVRPEHLDLPTPWPGHDVRALLGHLPAWLGGLARAATRDVHQPPATAEDHPPATGAGPAGGVPGAWWVPAWSAARGAFEEAWADRQVLDRLLPTRHGPLPGRIVLPLAVPGLAAHTWDLAVPLGRERTLAEDLGGFSLSLVRRGIPAGRRPVTRPGAGAPVPARAGAYLLLAARLGRTVA